MLPPAVEAHYRSQQRLAAVTVAAARRMWAGMSPDDFDSTWGPVRNRLTRLVASSQLSAARAGGSYVEASLEEVGIRSAAMGVPRAEAFAGWGSSGVPLAKVLDATVIRSKVAVARGMAPVEALQVGGRLLDGIAVSQVADASRSAAGVAIAARPKVGYTRMLNPPSCSRCAVLAGAFYRWNRGFLRHPQCDCRHVPSSEATAGDLTTDSRSYFDSLTPAQQAKTFTKAGADAINEGADIGRVVNARSGISPAGTTTTARARGQVRLTPEGIYERAADRGQAVALLKRYGYLL